MVNRLRNSGAGVRYFQVIIDFSIFYAFAPLL